MRGGKGRGASGAGDGAALVPKRTNAWPHTPPHTPAACPLPTSCAMPWLMRCARKRAAAVHTGLSLRLYERMNCRHSLRTVSPGGGCTCVIMLPSRASARSSAAHCIGCRRSQRGRLSGEGHLNSRFHQRKPSASGNTQVGHPRALPTHSPPQGPTCAAAARPAPGTWCSPPPQAPSTRARRRARPAATS